MTGLVIAIDGPSGAGKSTLARALAKAVGLVYLDTGAMYRAVAWEVLKNRVSLEDPQAVTRCAQGVEFSLTAEGQLFWNGHRVTARLRSTEVAETASRVAAVPGVRRVLVKQQQALGGRGGCVVEGRDMGTVVFPHADLKIFLTAGLSERARRRQRDFSRVGSPAALTQVARDLHRRDARDRRRVVAPLKPARDAVRLDTSRLTAKDTLARALSLVENVKREQGTGDRGGRTGQRGQARSAPGRG